MEVEELKAKLGASSLYTTAEGGYEDAQGHPITRAVAEHDRGMCMLHYHEATLGGTALQTFQEARRQYEAESNYNPDCVLEKSFHALASTIFTRPEEAAKSHK